MRTHPSGRRATLLRHAIGLAAGLGGILGSPLAHGEAPVAVEAPITSVVVYSDRARVTRSARVKLSGTQQVALPLLQGSVEPSSVRLESQGADVLRIETTYVDASDLPEDEAQRLLKSLEKVDDDLTRLRGEQEVYRAQVGLLQRMLPAVPPVPQGDAQRAPARLNPSGWPAVLAFLRGAQDKLHGKLAEGEERQRTLRRQRQELVEKARLLGGIAHRAGYRVVATLSGQGAAQVALTYMTAGARWLPTYDIQLLPAQNRVELALAGLVSQETGEDWSDVALTLSTAIPATATQLPKLLTWKIGQRERFTPTPQPLVEVTPPPPAVPEARPTASAGTSLRLQLLQRTGLSDERNRRTRLPDEPNQLPQGTFELGIDGDKNGDNLEADKTIADRSQRERYKYRDTAKDELQASAPAPASPAAPPPPPPEDAKVKKGIKGEYAEPDRDADGVPDSIDLVSEQATVTTASTRSFESVSRSVPRGPVVGVGLVPPAGYRAPQYAKNLPAALAGGYDLSYPSLYKDTIKSGQGSRRVALLAKSFPVSVLRKVTPALAPEAFLVAEIKNPASEPLPGGQANLFVGADPAGVASLQLVAAGETFTLPLGLDRAVKPIRNVRQTTEEKGVFSKDEVTEYTITTELVNPYRVPIEVKLLDQVPLAGDKHVEIKLVRSQPLASFEPIKGALEWRLPLPPGGKVVTQFVYTLRRPKGYRLSQ